MDIIGNWLSTRAGVALFSIRVLYRISVVYVEYQILGVSPERISTAHQQ
jgi:hypothetical protein